MISSHRVFTGICSLEINYNYRNFTGICLLALLKWCHKVFGFLFDMHLGFVNPTYYGPFGATSDIGGAQFTPLLVMHVLLVCYRNETLRD